MTLELADITIEGTALPASFVQSELGALLFRRGLLPKVNIALERQWSQFRHSLVGISAAAGPQRLHNALLTPLVQRLGYDATERQEPVSTREGLEDGGWLLNCTSGMRLRAWCVAAGTNLDAPNQRGAAYRLSPTRTAQRVLHAKGERIGLLTNGETLRLLITDPAGARGTIDFPLSRAGWRARITPPDSYRLLLALASPAGMQAIPEILDSARLAQVRVTKDLRVQARAAMEQFIQAVIEHPANAERLRRRDDKLAAVLWADGLLVVYRLLFILKLESVPERARAFSFASAELWRTALSPNRALASLARRFLDQGHDTGRMLEDGLRAAFRAFQDGIACAELSIAPLGGALFGTASTRMLDELAWGERAVAHLLDKLLWTVPKGAPRERVHYAGLDVEELGRIYEALLELEPGIASTPMIRSKHAQFEAVVPASGQHGESIPKGTFYLRAGFARKATGSYYTPHEFVRFLVRETLAPLVEERSSEKDPNPRAILALKVIDTAAGSGHFLVEACRFLGEALYSACCRCDERGLDSRLAELPDRSLPAYLPRRAGGSALAQDKALAICRRLAAVHCLYGVDRNPLAIELAKLSLWLESYAEGLPLTFLDHRLIAGDSLTGAPFSRLATLPVSGGPLDPLLAREVAGRLNAALQAALAEVRALESSIGYDVADITLKEGAKARLDAALAPLRRLAGAWSGAMMTATREADDEWLALAQHVASEGRWPGTLSKRQSALCDAGKAALPWDLTFPEVFRPDPSGAWSGGFDAILGNPPWDMVQPKAKDFLAALDPSILQAPTKREAQAIADRLLSDPRRRRVYQEYQESFSRVHRAAARLYAHQTTVVGAAPTGGKLDIFRLFAERAVQLAAPRGMIGLVVPSAFHANEGATGVRQLYMRHTELSRCLSFENRKRLFDIDSRFKYALIVARRPGPTRRVRCGFYLNTLEDTASAGRVFDLPAEFITASGGQHGAFLELRGAEDLHVARRLFESGERFQAWTAARGIQLSREIHMSDDAPRFTPYRAGRTLLPLHEGKTIHQFTDRWGAFRYGIAPGRLADKQQTLRAAGHFRVACREIAGSTNERSAIAAILPPAVLCGHTVNVERTPWQRPNKAALVLTAVLNSFAFDWQLRLRSASHVSLFILNDLVIPVLSTDDEQFLVQAALRLCCNHASFAPLWREQTGEDRAEWPVIGDETSRRALHAQMDAVIARAYGLSRDDYVTILRGFTHKSAAEMPALCLAAFDGRGEAHLHAA